MKTTLFILLILIMLPFTGLAQKDTLAQKGGGIKYNYQTDLDIELLGISIGRKKRIYNNWFIALKGGLGLISTRIDFGNGNSKILSENFNIQLSAQYSFFDFGFIEVGPKYSTSWEGPNGGSVNRVELTVAGYVGLKKVQIGLRVGVLSSNRNFGWQKEQFSNSLLILRIPLKRK